MAASARSLQSRVCFSCVWGLGFYPDTTFWAGFMFCFDIFDYEDALSEHLESFRVWCDVDGFWVQFNTTRRSKSDSVFV